MTTDLEQRLREALHDDATSARLVNPDGPVDVDTRVLPTPRHPRRSRWLAVAAVVAVVALVGALTTLDDEQKVDTSPATTEPAPLTIVSGGGCPFGVSGDPILMQSGPADPDAPRFDTVEGQGVAHTFIGDQVAEVRVPGFERASDNGWREEPIELAQGPATVWLDGPPSGPQNEPFVQVRYFPVSVAPCSSFTVTVDGGSEAANREAAIDLADRIVLPGEIADLDLDLGLELPATGDTTTTTVGQVVGSQPLPEAGEPPADPVAAEEQIRAAFVAIFDFSQPREGRAQFSERPAVWLAANEELVTGPYGDMIQDLHAEVDEVVFTDPTRAAVRFQAITSNQVVPRDQIGDAVLVDGQWRVAITTTCRMVAQAQVQCNMSL